ncbi:MAG TPA: UrcA family protein [Steroidobacteraceae bacterium]|nr:UrcA family protein [Steroidobacteraceae bacterium]
MSIRVIKKFVPALLTAGALGTLGTLGAAELPATADTTLPQAAHRISNWALNGHEGLWIEAVDGQWYYGEFLGPCAWATDFDGVTLKFNPDGSFNRFSYVIGRHPRHRCALKSFVHSEAPWSRQPLQSSAAAAIAGPATTAERSVPDEPIEQSEQLPEVVVEAGPVNRSVVGRSLTTGAPIELVKVDYHVRYADLDLVKHADVMSLQDRIETAARAACGQLDELFPLDGLDRQTRDCVQDAIRAAGPQIQQAIAGAQTASAEAAPAAELD